MSLADHRKKRNTKKQIHDEPPPPSSLPPPTFAQDSTREHYTKKKCCVRYKKKGNLELDTHGSKFGSCALIGATVRTQLPREQDEPSLTLKIPLFFTGRVQKLYSEVENYSAALQKFKETLFTPTGVPEEYTCENQQQQHIQQYLHTCVRDVQYNTPVIRFFCRRVIIPAR